MSFGKLLRFAGLLAIALPLRGADVGSTISHGLEFSTSHADFLASTVLVSPAVSTDYTNTSGFWLKKNRTVWTSGFVPGIFWLLYDSTGDSQWMQRAGNWTGALESNATDPDNDQGFQIYNSFGLGYELTGRTNTAYRNVLMTAASTFDSQRFNPTIGCYRSWTNTSANPVTNPQITDSTNNPNDPIFEVNIDQMMNLELPLYVGTLEGNATLIEHAVAHADRSWSELVRPNGSTFHVVGFNPDGSVQYQRTHQGWQTDSTWSRGQAWATYGFAMVYRYTELPRMLQRAEACFDYFMAAMIAQTSDMVPYSDFDAPLNALNPRDTSAAAIVASAAIDLFRMTGAVKYRDAAGSLLLALGGPDYLAEGTRFQAILRRGSQKWGTAEVGAIFGDFFFLEAMLRYATVIGLDEPANPGGTMINISTRGLVGTASDILIAGFVIEGTQPKTVLIRAAGPGLGALGVPNTLPDPVLTLYNQVNTSTPIGTNDNWGDAPNLAELQAARAAVFAFDFPTGSLDAAMLVTLEPGAYTVQVSGGDGPPQLAIVEVYGVD